MAAPSPRMTPEKEYEPYAWIPDYQAALIEADAKLLPHRIAKARESIVTRRVALHKGGTDDREIQALELALKTLRVLHNDLL